MFTLLSSKGQNIFQEENECKYYYDTLFQKNVYQTVDIFPSYDNDGINTFAQKITQNLKKKKITISKEEVLWNNSIIVSFIVNEKGYIENVQIGKKRKADYSKIDTEVLKIVKKLKYKKWSAGICNDKKVSTLVHLPIRINYRN